MGKSIYTLLYLGFQKRVLYLLTDIRHMLQGGYEPSNEPSKFHIEQVSQIDELNNLETDLKDLTKRQQLVSIINQPYQ